VLIAYLTLDEVNADLALRLAKEGGNTLYALVPRRPTPRAPFDALLYDWDYLPAERRQAVLAELLDRPLPCPVAVHGYNLDDDLGETLSRKGVAVSRYLEPELFVQLRSAADAVVQDAGSTESGVWAAKGARTAAMT
jgi:hypothetical protein